MTPNPPEHLRTEVILVNPASWVDPGTKPQVWSNQYPNRGLYYLNSLVEFLFAENQE